MEFEKAKEILSALSNYLPCHKYAFIGPAEQVRLESFLETARNLHKSNRPLKVLLTDAEQMDKILNENFPDAEFEIYIAAKYFGGKDGAIPFREYLQMEDIDFDVSKYFSA